MCKFMDTTVRVNGVNSKILRDFQKKKKKKKKKQKKKQKKQNLKHFSEITFLKFA